MADMERHEQTTIRRKKLKAGEPVWELARLFPSQGAWSEEDYLALDIGQQIEYSDGFLQVLPMPTRAHQLIVAFLYRQLFAFVQAFLPGSEVLFAPLPVRLSQRQYREPDLVFRFADRVEQDPGDYPHAADVVFEVVSGSTSDRDRDLVEKRHDYAQAGIPEYWIVDPDERVIVVLRMEGTDYVEHGRFNAGDTATSHLLPGFSVPVDDVWAAAQLLS